MLLTLATRSFETNVRPEGAESTGDQSFSMLDLPEYAITQLQLRGMNLPASMLSGWSLRDMDELRDRADKAGCPCLVLVEDQPLPFADDDAAKRAAAVDRVQRLAAAAHRLGCNALGLSVEAPNTDEAFELTATEVKEVMPGVERLELNLLIAPCDGLTADPERLTDLIKRIGGFRIGSLPSFGHAAESGDGVATLRKLAPYAGAIHATVNGFTKTGNHKGFDLAEYVTAIRSVGFVNTLAIDYRGHGDPAEGIDQARQILQEASDAE